MSDDFVFPNFQVKCARCGKARGLHKAVTLHCPTGSPGRIGYTTYSQTLTFIEKTTKQKATK